MLNVNDKDYIKRSLGYPDDGTVPSTMHDYIRLMLASHRIPIKASVPGGIDPTAAREGNIRILHGGGLPGRCFPESAGVIVAETVLSLLPKSNRKEEPLC